MRSNEYYNKKSVTLLTLLSIVVYMVFSTFTMEIISNAASLDMSEFTPNFDKSYNKVVALDYQDDIEDKDNKESYSLSSVEYDISTLYLDWTEIDKERKRIEKEYAEAKKNAIVSSNVQEGSKLVSVLGSLSLPDIEDTSFKGYMCMHKVTSRTSKQWEFLHSGNYEFNTDNNGIMMYGDYYVVAMGSYYTGYKVGSTFRITLDSNITFDVITGDEKADVDTDVNNSYRPKGSSRGEIVEFIIACGEEGAVCNNYNTISDESRRLGNLSSLGFKGNISKIEVINDTNVKDRLYR